MGLLVRVSLWSCWLGREISRWRWRQGNEWV